MTTQVKNILKNIVFYFFPEYCLSYLRKYHFYLKLKKFNASDEEDLLMLEKIIDPKFDAIDIGANIGLYTKYMSKCIKKSSKVLSIEPVKETYKYLTNNIRKLKLTNVTAINIAVSDKQGKAIMQIPRFGNNRLNFYEAAITNNPDNSLIQFEVETSTLDAICALHNIKPSFIKCDVEGHEWQVFKGANYVLTKFKPILLVEINPNIKKPDFNTQNLLNYLGSMGYEIYVNSSNRLKKTGNEKKFNYYFITEEHIGNLKEIVEK